MFLKKSQIFDELLLLIKRKKFNIVKQNIVNSLNWTDGFNLKTRSDEANHEQGKHFLNFQFSFKKLIGSKE